MHIRPGVPDDAERIETIRIRGWQTAYRSVFPPADLDAMAVDASRWCEWLAGNWEQRCFVYEQDGIVVGWTTTAWSGEPGTGEVRGIYVDPDAWSTGAGGALLQRAEDELAETYTDAILWTLEANGRARRFYERNGWVLDGRRGTFERFGVAAVTVRYAKALSSSTSRG